jgi:alpha-amylase/alpha-mannosidase (GH57 family)
MERWVCIHGHFYQPPRENPWLETVEIQDSAHPYHDWNERITAECYAPNGAARILDGERRIVDIVNNYSRISFNFGPTLLAWLERHAPAAYRAIVEADRESRGRCGGHGAALAQGYNHLILPLATRRDKVTQVVWGIRDFEHRFGRRPEGMWLPETAVDLETLEVLAEHGICFTVLAPRQAAAVRRVAGGSWRDVGGGRVDPSRAYRQTLPSGRTIALFFYDGPISQGIAFEHLLDDGEAFAGRVTGAFVDSRQWPQLVHIATDGETYGHHHRHGDMALAYALSRIERGGHARLTNYGEFLERHPPTHAVRIAERTSWSCAHGIERWRSDCGCRGGADPRWNQGWRAPLRDALDWLRDELAPRYERAAAELLTDPWAARDGYIAVVLDRSPESLDRFFTAHAARALTPDERTRALELLELQRHTLLMYTSCGWFFDELSGLETVQVIQYAGRAVQLAEKLFDEPVEGAFLERLARARSNLAEHGDGRRIYEKWVKPTQLDLLRVGAHHAVASVFDGGQPRDHVFCYAVDRTDHRVLRVGQATLAIGRATVTSEVTRESADQTFAVLHLGDHTVSGGVRAFRGDEAYAELCRELGEAFGRADFPETLRLVDRHLDGATHSLRSLFRDEQRRVVDSLLQVANATTEAAYRDLYDRHAPLMRFLKGLGTPVPPALRSAAELVLNADLRRALGPASVDVARVAALLDSARQEDAHLDAAGLGFAFDQALARLEEELRGRPTDAQLLDHATAVVGLAAASPFEVDLWRLQNLCHGLARAASPAEPAWLGSFRRLCDAVRLRVD